MQNLVKTLKSLENRRVHFILCKTLWFQCQDDLNCPLNQNFWLRMSKAFYIDLFTFCVAIKTLETH